MSLLLITGHMVQVSFFQLDKDTLGLHFNVAGTGKAGAKVRLDFGSGSGQPPLVRSGAEYLLDLIADLFTINWHCTS